MKMVRSFALIISLSTLLLPMTTFAAGGGVVHRSGTISSADAAKILVARASSVYSVTVTVTAATGRYGATEACTGTGTPLSSMIAAACRKAGGSYVVGKVATATGTGFELAAGAASVKEMGVMTPTVGVTGAVSATKVISGLAGGLFNSVTYMQITPTTAVTMPTTAADAKAMALAMFPKLASGQYLPLHSQPGTYGFFAQALPYGMSNQGSAIQAMRSLIIVFKNSAGQPTVGAVVATGGAATTLHK